MHILNDFFLLNWNEQAKLIEDLPQKFSKHIYNCENFDNFCDSASILLIINSENAEKMLELKESKTVFNGIFEGIVLERCLILQAQKELLNFLIEKGDSELNKNIKARLEILRKEGIITYFVSQRLITLLSLIKEKREKNQEIELHKAKRDKNGYKNLKNIIKTAVENLKLILESPSQIERLDQLTKKFDEQRFSIGVTGVMNSGKSTMLNALLQKEILGTATVPETANLTLLKYSRTEFARVNFWKKSEFERIEKSAQNSEKIRKFIEETKKHFADELGKYITKSGNSKEIAIDELVYYTSAQKSDKRANLVKSVELYSNLKFLKDSVEIVDTPGLDDPIIQREEITLEYLKDCDLMCHLMNVNQAATKKDVDFIINSILYQNIARILIVITRIDTVSKSELQEVLEYVKSSIKKRLKNLNKSNQIDTVINKLEFLPLSAKMALLHRLGKGEEALKKGYSLQKSGILEFEAYLEKILFGDNSPKIRLLTDSFLSELSMIIDNALKNYESEKELLHKSSAQVLQEADKFEKEKKEIISYLEKLDLTIKIKEEELKEYIKTLQRYVNDKLEDLTQTVNTRVIDDISYELRKNKRLPKKERIEYIVDIGLKDGLIDLVRDYRYQFQKRLSRSFEELSVKLGDFIVENSDDFEFDTKEFFDKNFKSFISFTQRETLISGIENIVEKYGKKDLQTTQSKLMQILKNEIEEIKLDIDEKLEIINQEILKEFVTFTKKPLNKIKEEIESKDMRISKALEMLDKSSYHKQSRLSEIDAKLKALKELKSELESIK